MGASYNILSWNFVRLKYFDTLRRCVPMWDDGHKFTSMINFQCFAVSFSYISLIFVFVFIVGGVYGDVVFLIRQSIFIIHIESCRVYIYTFIIL